MSEAVNFKESVLDHLENAFIMIMTSINDEQLAYKIIEDVYKEFLRIHPCNSKKIREQKNSEYKNSHNQTLNNRKQARRRRYHPTGAFLFYFLIKERLAYEEKKNKKF